MDPTTNPSDPKAKPKIETDAADAKEEEKPIEREPIYETDAYRAVKDKLAEVDKTYDALFQKQSEDRAELIKLSELKCDLHEELRSMCQSDRKKIKAHFSQQPLDPEVEKPNLHTSSSSSSSSSLGSTIIPTKPSGSQKRKLESETAETVVTEGPNASSSSGTSNPHHLNVKEEEEEKPAKRVPVYKTETYKAVKGDLVKCEKPKLDIEAADASSVSGVFNPQHLNEKRLIVKKEKPFEVVSLIAEEEYRAVHDKLAKSGETYQALYHKVVASLDELIKLTLLKDDLSRELMSIYKNSSA